MSTILIDQFCDAVKQWGKKTGKGAFPIVIMSISHIGAYTKISNQEDKERMFDYRAYLINLVEETKISQGLLISGLIKMIELELTHLTMSYNTWVEETQDKANFARKLADDPDFRIQFMDAINQERLEKGLEPFAFNDPDNLSKIADYLNEQTNDVDDNEAERKMALLEWQEITSTLLDYNNLWRIVSDDSKDLIDPL